MPRRDRDSEPAGSRPPFPDDSGEVLPCPHCFAVNHDESVRCPRCGEYLSDEIQEERKPWWVIAAALVLLALSILWIFRPE